MTDYKSIAILYVDCHNTPLNKMYESWQSDNVFLLTECYVARYLTSQVSNRIKSDWSKPDSGQWANHNKITVKNPVRLFSFRLLKNGSVTVNLFPTLVHRHVLCIN